MNTNLADETAKRRSVTSSCSANRASSCLVLCTNIALQVKTLIVNLAFEVVRSD
jgi:hypothetical protein